MNATSPQQHKPRRPAGKRARIYVHTWTSAAAIAAITYTVLETAGIRNP